MSTLVINVSGAKVQFKSSTSKPVKVSVLTDKGAKDIKLRADAPQHLLAA